MIKRIVLITIFFIGLIIDIHYHDSGIKQELSFTNSVALAGSWLILVSFFILIDALRNKYITFIFGFIIAILFYFSKRMGFYAGFTIINNNIDYLKSWAGWNQLFALAYDTFYASDVFYSLLLACCLFATTYASNEKFAYFFRNKLVLIICFAWIILASILLPYSHDPISWLVRGCYQNFVPNKNLLAEQSENSLPLPGIRIDSHFTGRIKKNIFLILVESFNDRFVNEKTADGAEYLPFFNGLTKKYFYAKNYFSNSVYTSKSQFSAICGQVPMLKKTEFRNASCLQKKCTPEVIQQAGYSTFFVQADPNFNVENTKQFMLSHGFENFLELAKPCNVETEKCYGLGVKDEVFYRRIFEFINKPEFIETASKKPIFITISTVSSHMPFTFLEQNERKFYKSPQNRREHYLNFLNVIDDGLKAFFTEFEKSLYYENSIVIVTGDHGFPLGEHGNFHNSSFAYQENFDVPLLIFEKGSELKSKYALREERPFSHLNLGPTILDLAQFSGPTDFIAPSIFESENKSSDLYLIQPFGGGMLAVISWPYKYIFSTFRSKEWVYNLKDDYEERRPLTVSNELMMNLRKKAAQIYRQQDVYSCDTNGQLKKNLEF